MNFTIGLDIGIASIGWAVINWDKEKIEALGVRAFDKAENPKDGSSLALPRRQARGARRTTQRKAQRMKNIKNIIVRQGILTENELNHLYDKPVFEKNPYELRMEALDRLLTKNELARVLIHIAKHRGFKSNRKSEIVNAKSDDKKVLGSIEENKNIMLNREYRSVAEMMVKDDKFKAHKRNKQDDYKMCVSRDMLVDETVLIFDSQRKFSSDWADIEFENEYIDTFTYQRHYASGQQIEKMIGKCSLLEGELRAPRSSWSAEWFNVLQKINHLRLIGNGRSIRLSETQRRKIMEMCISKKKIVYAQIRKTLHIDDGIHFSGITYSSRVKKDPEKTVFFEMKGYHKLKTAIIKNLGETEWDNINQDKDLIDNIATALTWYKDDETIINKMREFCIKEDIINVVLGVDMTKNLHLSLKALRMIIPYMEQGMIYNEACAVAGIDFKGNNCDIVKTKKLPVIQVDELKNPILIRSLTQTRKVLNSIIEIYGSPSAVHIELARDLSHSFDERRDIKKGQEEYQSEKDRLRKEIIDTFGIMPNGFDLLKYRLWKQQGERCVYSLKSIESERLFEDGYLDIDHIIPYSRSFDDSMNNKVLVMKYENTNKRNNTPYEYFGHDENRWHKFSEIVKQSQMKKAKKDRLLKKEFTEEDQLKWKDRSLNDTRYICRYFKNYVESHLLFADDGRVKKVYPVNGRITSLLRAKWGLLKNREKSDKHHALDAAVVAVTTDAMINRINRYAKVYESKKMISADKYVDADTGEILNIPTKGRQYFPQPWVGFRSELLARLSDKPPIELAKIGLESYSEGEIHNTMPIFISRKPRRKASGQAHKATIRSRKLIDKGINKTYERKWLADLKASDLENMLCKQSDPKLYNAIVSRFNEFNGEAKKAFAEPLYKPAKNVERASVVKAVKVMEVKNSGEYINKGIADNGNMVRSDIFKKDGKFYIVPIYVADIFRWHKTGKLPERAIKAHASYDEWPVMDESCEFQFSLYPYDLIEVKDNKGKYFGYYFKCHRGAGSLSIRRHDNPNVKQDVITKGIKNALSLVKYNVSVLGKYYPMKGEKRDGLA